jgi:cytochrome c peroxidase
MLVGALLVVYVAFVIVNGTLAAVSRTDANPSGAAADARNERSNRALFLAGRNVFRNDTFGDEAFWGGALQLHRAIAGAKNGGVGPGLSPKAALAAGLKVDSAAIPKKTAAAIKAGKVDLNDPAVTLALLKLNAVVGVKGLFDGGGRLTSVGLTCASCHSVVDDSFAPGIGRRLDGWPNRDLNVGAIIGLAPNKKPLTDVLGVDEATVDKVLASWGPGRFDAVLFFDGKAFRPDGHTAATLIPPAFGLAGVDLATYTGWGSVTYWNALVANLEMHGRGNFDDDRLDNAQQFPVAAKNRFGHVRNRPDLVTAKLPALHFYQLALPAPKPPKGSFDAAAARRGQAVFEGKGGCQGCHMQPIGTQPGWNLVEPKDICIDAFTANRSPTGRYRTTPLGGLFTRSKGGYYHDGRFPTLTSVVEHYNSCLNLKLTDGEKGDLVQYLRSR